MFLAIIRKFSRKSPENGPLDPLMTSYLSNIYKNRFSAKYKWTKHQEKDFIAEVRAKHMSRKIQFAKNGICPLWRHYDVIEGSKILELLAKIFGMA